MSLPDTLTSLAMLHDWQMAGRPQPGAVLQQCACGSWHDASANCSAVAHARTLNERRASLTLKFTGAR